AIAQCQLQHARGRTVEDLAVGDSAVARIVPHAAGSHDELANAARVVTGAHWGLRRKALVVVLVTRKHQFGTVVVQRLPDRLRAAEAAVLGAGAEARVVPVCDGAALRARRQIGAEPLLLRRTRGHADVAVERYDEPGA